MDMLPAKVLTVCVECMDQISQRATVSVIGFAPRDKQSLQQIIFLIAIRDVTEIHTTL